MMEDDETAEILEEIFADSDSDISSDHDSLSASEDSDNDCTPTTSTPSKKQNFRSGWREASASYKQRAPVEFTAHTGCTEDFSNLSPLQIFQLYFCQAVWELMVTETNRYAQQTLSSHDTANPRSAWTPTCVPEMMAFVALLLCMGINRRPRYTMHWSRSQVLRSPIYASTMSRNRFSEILRYFHLADNTAPDTTLDKLFKVRPLLEIVLPSFHQVYRPGRNLSPDETMVKFKGRLGFKQYMPRKSAKWGLKCFSLNESETGYTCAWKMYTGSEQRSPQPSSQVKPSIAFAATHHPPNMPAQGRVVLDLVKGLEHKGHFIFMDNWYTSPALVSKLSDLGFAACGTVRYRTLGIPDYANPKKFPMEKGADPQFYTKAGQLCVVWRDTKPVTLLTNVGDCTVTNHQMRSRKDATGYREVKRPDIVTKYNKYMGGSDLAAQLCQYYTHHHRSLKWWKRVFVNILDICLLNANVVYNSIPSNDRVSSLDFRVKVIEGLLSTHKKNPACITVELSHGPNPFAEQHYPGRNVGNKKRDCVVCSTRTKRRQTRMMCKQCQRPMCVIPCFEKFHAQ